MKKRATILLCLGFLLTPMKAQTLLSLEECLQIGLENNLPLQGKKNEVIKGKYTISENRARLLPQINGFANFNDNFEPPVSVTDGTAFGNPYNVTKTLQYNASAGIQLRMPLYDQTVYTTVAVAKMMEQLSRLSYEKAKEDLMIEISKLYYLGQTTTEQISA